MRDLCGRTATDGEMENMHGWCGREAHCCVFFMVVIVGCGSCDKQYPFIFFQRQHFLTISLPWYGLNLNWPSGTVENQVIQAPLTPALYFSPSGIWPLHMSWPPCIRTGGWQERVWASRMLRSTAGFSIRSNLFRVLLAHSRILPRKQGWSELKLTWVVQIEVDFYLIIVQWMETQIWFFNLVQQLWCITTIPIWSLLMEAVGSHVLVIELPLRIVVS